MIPIPGTSEAFLRDDGTVYNGLRRREIAICINSVGYSVFATKNLTGKRQVFLLHRKIWETLVGPIPRGLVINHKNGIKTDNRLENLEVVTLEYNSSHSRWVLGNNPSRARRKVGPDALKKLMGLRAEGKTLKECAKELGVSPQLLSQITRLNRDKYLDVDPLLFQRKKGKAPGE